MHQTANFQLNQWEATDRILREDFNADNAKLDAALEANADAIAAEASARQSGDAAIRAALPMVSVYAKTLSVPQDRLDIATGGLGLTDYLMLVLYLEAPCSFSISLLANNATSYETINSHGGSSYLAIFNNSGGTCGGAIRLFSPFSSSTVHCAFYRSSGYTVGEVCNSCNFTWGALETLNLVPNGGQLPAGTKVRIYGLKK